MMRNLLRVWLWLALLGPVAATAGGVFGPDSTARGSASAADAKAVAAQTTANTAIANAATAQGTANTAVTNAATAQAAVDNLKSGTDAATKLRVGASSSLTDAPKALVHVASGDTAATVAVPVGLFSEAVGEATGAAYGIYSVGGSGAIGTAYGVLGVGKATTDNSSRVVGVYGVSTTAHALGDNVALMASASGGVNNYALEILSGDIKSASATTWTATGGLTVNGGLQYRGVTSGASPSAGYVGESSAAAIPAVNLTSGVPANVGSVTLQAGMWMVWATFTVTPDASTSVARLRASISTVSATHGASGMALSFAPVVYGGNTAELGSAVYMVNSSGPTTLYFVCSSVFTVAGLSCSANYQYVRIH